MFLFSNKIGTKPTKIYLLLHAASCSPNLDNLWRQFTMLFLVPHCIQKGIILEAKTRSMFVKRKLDGNLHKLDKGIYIINILAMTNYLAPSTHQSLDPLCILFSTPQPSVGNTIQNNSYKGIPTNATLSKVPSCSHNSTWNGDSILGCNGGELCSTRPLASSKDNQYNKNHLLSYGLCKLCFLMFNIHKTRGTNYCPLLLQTTLHQNHPQCLEIFFWFCLGNMANCVGGLCQTWSTTNPSFFPNVWHVNLCTNIIQCEANALGQTNFVLVHGGPFVTSTIEFNELRFLLGLALSVRNGLKICANKHI